MSLRKFLLAIFATVLLVMPTAYAAQTWTQVYEHIESDMQRVLNLYESGDAEGAKNAVNDIYYGIYEKDGLESAVRNGISAKSANLTEYQFYNLKKSIRNSESQEAVKAHADKLLEMINIEVTTLETAGIESGGWGMFLQAFLILLREGVEAMLVLVGIIAYLGRAGHEKAIGTVYNWSIAAIFASFVSAYLFNSVIGATESGASRELIEGFTALFAVAVLLATSAWMGGKANAEEWKKYISGMVKMSLSSGKLRALGFAAFLAVYREGAEVILFYQALFNNATGDVDMIWLGFVAACAVLAIMFFLVQRGALKIPIAPFFMVTSVFMFILAVTFTGGGIKELQEAGVVSTNMIPDNIPVPSIDLLGLYPTYETVIPQVVLILTALAAVLYKRRQQTA